MSGSTGCGCSSTGMPKKYNTAVANSLVGKSGPMLSTMTALAPQLSLVGLENQLVLEIMSNVDASKRSAMIFQKLNSFHVLELEIKKIRSAIS